VVSWLTKLSVFTINSIQITGADSDIAPTLQTVAEQTLFGNYLGIFSRKSIVTYPRSALVRSLRAVSPRIDDVVVRIDGLHQILIAIIEKVPSAIACPELPDFDNMSIADCYLVDQSGLAFQKTTDSFPQTFNRYYVPDSVLGSNIASSTKFLQLQKAYDSVKANNIDVLAILLKPNNEYEMYVKSPQKSDMTVIYLNEAQPIPDEISNLITFWTHATSTLEYIDVRYGSNIFYR